jgi:integrase
MSYQKLPDGRWTSVVRGERVYHGRGLEAEQAARERHQAAGLRTWTKPQSQTLTGMTFGQVAEKYMDAGMTRMERSTYDKMIRRLNYAILPELGHRPAVALTAELMDEFVLKRMRGGWMTGSKRFRVAPPASRTTIRSEVLNVKTILRWGQERGYYHFMPLERYKAPRASTVPEAPPTVDEMARIYRVAPRHVQRAIALGWFLCLRGFGSELFRLRWDHINWTTRQILVQSARKGGPISGHLRIHPTLYALLKVWSEEDACPYLVHWHGKVPKDIRPTWRRCCDRAGVRRMRPYLLRHQGATAMIAEGADIKSVQTIMRHSNPNITLSTYSHGRISAEDAAIALIPDFLFGNLPSVPPNKKQLN